MLRRIDYLTLCDTLLEQVRAVANSQETLLVTLPEHGIVAKLTLKKPASGKLPIRKYTKNVVEDWHLFFDSIAHNKACFFFSIKCDGESTKVYLAPYDKFVNPYEEESRLKHEAVLAGIPQEKDTFSDEDVEKLANSLARKMGGKLEDSIELGLKSGNEPLRHAIGTAFAFANRNGDLLATPEMGLVPRRGAGDFYDPPEA